MKHFLILLLLVQVSLKAQDLTEDQQMQIDFAIDFFYEDGSKMFIERPFYFERKDIETPLFLKELPSESVLKQALQQFKRNSSLELSEFGSMSSLSLKSTLEAITWDFQKMVQVSLLNSNLKDAQGKEVLVNDQISTSYSETSSSNFVNGKKITKIRLETNSGLFFKEDKPEGPNGEISFKVALTKGYEVVKISSDDIKKEFRFKGVNNTVIAVLNNYVVFKPETYDPDQGIDFNVTHLSKDDKQTFSRLASTAIETRKANGEVFNKEMLDIGQGILTMPKKIYDIFKKKPSISKEKFRKLTLPLFTECLPFMGDYDKMEAVFGPTYLVIQELAPIEHCYLYVPKKVEEITINKQL